MKKFKLVTLLVILPDYIRMFKVIKLLDENQKNLKELPEQIKELLRQHYYDMPSNHRSKILIRLQKNNLIKFLLLLITVLSIIISIISFFGKHSLKK